MKNEGPNCRIKYELAREGFVLAKMREESK